MSDLQKWEILRDEFMIQNIKIKLTLASGTFIVTLAFLSKNRVMFYKGVLLISWICLVISIVMGMWATMVKSINTFKLSLQPPING